MSSTSQTGAPTPVKSPNPPGAEVGEGEKDEYIIAAVSGLVAFATDKETAEKIHRFIKEKGWKVYEIPQFERRRHGRTPTYEVLVKLLPQHWLYFSYSQNRAYFEFSSPEWLSDEEAQRKIKEEDGWEERHFILCPALRTRLFGCTSRIKTLPPPPQ